MMLGESDRFVMDMKQFKKNCLFIGRTGDKLDGLVHETAIGGLEIAQETRDCRHMDVLLKALPKSTHFRSFGQWVQAFSPIRWNGDGKIGMVKEGSKTYTPFDIEGAKAKPFWEFAPKRERQVTELSPSAIIAYLQRELKKASAADDASGSILNADGEVTQQVDGNVAEYREFLSKMLFAAETARPRPKLATQDGKLLRDGQVISDANLMQPEKAAA